MAFHIAIIGGGPGGLTLARVLQIHGIRVTVFEQGTSGNARSQGDSLDLHQEGGLKALRTASLFDEFMKYARYEGQQMRVIDKSEVVHLDEEGPMGLPGEDGEDDRGRPEIDRADLRQILLNSFDDGTVHHAARWELGGRNKLVFENMRQETVDLVVGADGAWSLIRLQLSYAKPLYSGISFIDLTISSVESRCPPVPVLACQEIAFILSNGKGLIAQRNSGGRVRVYVALRVAEGWLDEFERGFRSNGQVDSESARDTIINLFPDWSPELLDLLRFSDLDSIVLRKIYALPVPHVWQTKCGLTLLGDAAHLMSLFAGEGVNLAMIYAVDLGLALLNVCKATGDGSKIDAPHGKRLEEAVRGYEKTMRERGAEMVKESAENLNLIFSEHAPKPFLDRMAFYHS